MSKKTKGVFCSKLLRPPKFDQFWGTVEMLTPCSDRGPALIIGRLFSISRIPRALGAHKCPHTSNKTKSITVASVQSDVASLGSDNAALHSLIAFAYNLRADTSSPALLEIFDSPTSPSAEMIMYIILSFGLSLYRAGR
jgi:hypothetical protein